MLINRLESLIKKQNIELYQIETKKKTQYELFYVLQNLETSRCVETETATVTLYKQNEDLMGQASFNCTSGYSDKELEQMILKAYERCLFVINKKFELPENEEIEYMTNDYEKSQEDVAYDIAKAIFASDNYKDGWINSTEIFVINEEKAFINSKGVNVNYKWNHVFIEMIPTWKGTKEEVELYFSKSFSKLDLDAITKMIDEKLNDAKGRAEAIEIPDMKEVDCILGSSEAMQIFNMFASNASFHTIYNHMNKYNLNDQIQSSDDCDKMNVLCTGYLENATSYSPIDSFGTKVIDTKVIENGVLTNLFGDCKNAYYLNQKPTGNPSCLKVNKGSISKEDIKTPYLYCKDFSAFQLDMFTGYYGGEVRLAIYFDGNKEIPVSGFTVSGNIYEDINHMRFSNEIECVDNYEGPKYLFVKMSVNK